MARNPNKLNILVIDDDAEMCTLIQSHLKDQGHCVTACSSPLEAIFLMQMQMVGVHSDDGPFYW